MTGKDFAALSAKEMDESNRGIFGVPDSTLTELLHHLAQIPRHQTAANEGAAVGMAIGYWLQTKLPSHVYLQNSGLLNAGNPLISLVHETVYDVPMTLTVGWRGRPNSESGSTDEPQHLESGQKTESFLSSFGFNVVNVESKQDYFEALKRVHSSKDSRDAILVPRGVFDSRESTSATQNSKITRRQAVELIYGALSESHAFVSGTGYMSRDLASVIEESSAPEPPVFYMVGGMGHVASVAAGVSLAGRNKRVAAIEGDGGALMHLGSIANLATPNVKSVDLFILQNGVHASVGGQPVSSPDFDFETFADACGFSSVSSVSSRTLLQRRLDELSVTPEAVGSTLTVVLIGEPEFLEPSKRPTGFRSLARKFNHWGAE